MSDGVWVFLIYFAFAGYAITCLPSMLEEIKECYWRRKNGIARNYDYWDGEYRELDWPPAYATMAGVVALKLCGILNWSWSWTIICAILAGSWLAPMASYWIIAWRHHREERAAQARIKAWRREASALQRDE